MNNNIKQKINNILVKNNYSEQDVAYFFVETYKLLESENKLSKFPTIKFYRDWVCHSVISKYTEKIFYEVYILIKARKYMPDDIRLRELGIDKIFECFKRHSFIQLKNEVNIFLNSFLDKEKLNWEKLRGELYKIIMDTPLLIKENSQELLRFECKKSIIGQLRFDELQILGTADSNIMFNFRMDDTSLELLGDPT